MIIDGTSTPVMRSLRSVRVSALYLPIGMSVLVTASGADGLLNSRDPLRVRIQEIYRTPDAPGAVPGFRRAAWR